MSFGRIVYFLSGQVRLVRMELWARILQNLLIGNEIRAYMPHKPLEIGTN